MADSPTAVAHLITADAPLLGSPAIDVLPTDVPLGEQQPVWSRPVPAEHGHDVAAFLRGLTAFGWPPVDDPVEIEHGYVTVTVRVPDEMRAAVQARPGPRPRVLRPGGAADLADELGVDVGDVLVMLERLGLTEAEMTDKIGAAIREDLDQFCIRTVPEFWYPGSNPEAGRHATRMRSDHAHPVEPGSWADEVLRGLRTDPATGGTRGRDAG